MEINKSETIQSLVSNRRKHDSEIFFVDTNIVSTEFGVSVVKKKQYFGVSLDGEVVLSPIYDDIVVLTHSTVALKIKDRISLYNVRRNISITDFSYKSMERIGPYWKLNKESDSFLLYDPIRETSIYNNGKYDEYNLKCNYTEYYWARRGSYFDYIQRESGKIFSLSGVVMAYDTEIGMFGKNEDGTVSLFEESGIANVMGLREMVCEAGGYLVLTNFTYNVQHIIDVYGNILNI